MSEPATRLPPPRPAPVTLSALLDELLWPRLLRVPAMALRSDRLILAFLGVLGVALCASLSSLWVSGPGFLSRWLEGVGQGLAGAWAGVIALDGPGAASGLTAAVVAAPRDAFRLDPWGAFVTLPLALAVWMAVGGAIARSIACDFSAGVRLAWPAALGFGVQRAGALFFAAALPLGIAGAIALAVSAAGWALFGAPVLDVIGSLAFTLLALGTFIAVLIAGVMLVGGNLLAPAIACEGTDAIDAVQRTMNYVLHRPLMLAMYGAIALATGAAALFVASVLLSGAMEGARALVLAWSGTRAEGILDGVGGTDGSADVASSFIRLWSSAAAVLLAAFGVSLYFSFSTLLYLFARQKNDLQHFSEIWFPGIIGGTMASGEPGSGVRIEPAAAGTTDPD